MVTVKKIVLDIKTYIQAQRSAELSDKTMREQTPLGAICVGAEVLIQQKELSAIQSTKRSLAKRAGAPQIRWCKLKSPKTREDPGRSWKTFVKSSTTWSVLEQTLIMFRDKPPLKTRMPITSFAELRLEKVRREEDHEEFTAMARPPPGRPNLSCRYKNFPGIFKFLFGVGKVSCKIKTSAVENGGELSKDCLLTMLRKFH